MKTQENAIAMAMGNTLKAFFTELTDFFMSDVEVSVSIVVGISGKDKAEVENLIDVLESHMIDEFMDFGVGGFRDGNDLVMSVGSTPIRFIGCLGREEALATEVSKHSLGIIINLDYNNEDNIRVAENVAWGSFVGDGVKRMASINGEQGGMIKIASTEVFVESQEG